MLGVVCTCFAMVLVVTLAEGNSSAPWLPITGQGDKTDEKVIVETEPEPTKNAATESGTPSVTPSVSQSTPTSVAGSASSPRVPDPTAPTTAAGDDVGTESAKPTASPAPTASESPGADNGSGGSGTTPDDPVDPPENPGNPDNPDNPVDPSEDPTAGQDGGAE